VQPEVGDTGGWLVASLSGLLGSSPFGSAGAGAVDARLSTDGKTLPVDRARPV
jgi:hypothetical protein